MPSELANELVDDSLLAGVIVHLSGSRRGKSEPLPVTTLRVAAGRRGEVSLLAPEQAQGKIILATLHPFEESYEIVSDSQSTLWINGTRVHNKKLQSGDVIEFGDGLAVVRFRLYPRGMHLHKSVAQAFSDCVECARHDHRPTLGRTSGFFVDVVKEMSTHTSLWFRASVIAALLALGAFVVVNVQHTKDLEQRLSDEKLRVQDLYTMLERAEKHTPTRAELAALQAEIEQGASSNEERFQILEARPAATRKAIARAAQAVVFIQGSFGFNDAESGRPLRMIIGPNGEPVRTLSGRPGITLEGDGPPVEVIYTGSAFIVSEQGLLLTNRHVAIPWEHEKIYQDLIEKLDLVPVIKRFLGYLAGEGRPFEIEIVRASEDADVALLRYQSTADNRIPLELRAKPPQPGDEVIVLGYPTGIRALLARAGNRFVKSLTEGDQRLDAWQIAQALGEAGFMAPLASRGIVGQVTSDAIVYDAETTQGGSGGPVVLLTGEVVAINAAILPEFGGSNLGVPVHYASALLQAD